MTTTITASPLSSHAPSLYIIFIFFFTDKELKPFLEKIDEIEKSIAELEKAVIGLDEYTKRLETRYKKVIKSVK